MTLMLDTEVLAIGILATQEIIEHHDLTVAPMMPESILARPLRRHGDPRLF